MDDYIFNSIEKQGYGYSKKWDAFYDLKTLEWLEEPCGCEQCERRPPRFPMMKVAVNNDKKRITI